MLTFPFQSMSLLDSDDEDPFTDELLKGHTEEPLFGETASKGKAKKKARAEERKASSKPGHWKQKGNVVTVQDKTPKKVKGQSGNKGSVSKTPPDSPKSSRPTEMKGTKGGAVGVASGQVQQPSPNVKSQRKRYSQLGAGSSSEEGEGDGFLFSNAPALRDETDVPKSQATASNQPSNPFLGNQTLLSGSPPTGHTPSIQPTAVFPPATGLQLAEQHQAWLPSSNTTSGNLQDFFSPQQPGHAPSPPTLLVMGGDGVRGVDGRLASPTRGATLQDFSMTNPFLLTQQLAPAGVGQSPFQPGPTFGVTPPPTSQPPPTQLHPHGPPSPPTAVPTEGVASEDWGISDDLHCKCVQQFKELEPVQGVLAGDKAREFFVQSKLPNQELSSIW